MCDVLTRRSNDCLSGIIASPMRIYFDYINGYTLTNCYFIICFTRSCGYISVFSILMISFERYIKILHSQIYIKYIKMHTLKCILIFLWIISFLLSFAIDVKFEKLNNSDWRDRINYCFYDTIIRKQQGIAAAISVQIGIIFVVILIHIILFSQVKKHFLKLENKEKKRHTSGEHGVDNYERKAQRLRMEIKIAVMTIIIAVSYALFVIPIVVIDIIRLVDLTIDGKHTVYMPESVIKVAITLVVLYPTVESVLFLYLNKPVWERVRTTLTLGLPSIAPKPHLVDN
ncbi:hypothetical protein HZS_4149 [Henneguya salminicola]|nr:hypothetical protein HZS_4149 [Henneguya salminicola]